MTTALALGSDAAYRCPVCAFAVFVPVASLVVSEVGLYDDDRFPGRCILVLRKHYEHLDLVPEDLAYHFLDDARTLGNVLRTQFNAERINYAVLGNVERHVHGHVIPRYASGDPVRGRPVWEHPSKPASLGNRRDPVVRRLRVALQGGGLTPS